MAERAALITGGSSGIGLAIARALGEDGYGVTISARRPEKLESAAEGLRGEGLDVLSVPARMAEEEELRTLVEAHRERFGRLDVLVNNAGAGTFEAMHELSTESVDTQLEVNLRGMILTTRECLPLLRDAGSEHGKALIVNMASTFGKAGVPGLSVYSATKAALIGFSQSTQREVANDGVQVTAFAPGMTDTAVTESAGVNPEEKIQPADLAEAVRFLLRTSRNCVVPEIVFRTSKRHEDQIGLRTDAE